MQKQTIGVAVAGAGRWGHHLVRNFLQHPQATLVALVDQNEDHLQTLANKYDLASTETFITKDWETALQLPSVDAVAIATPAATHYELIRAALLHGKHVLVEKPITLDARQALELCNLAESVQRQLVVDHTYLFNAAVDKGRYLLSQEKLGRLRYGYATRTHLGPIRQDVDALWDLAIHDISIFSHWLDEFPSIVQAQGKIWLQRSLPYASSSKAIPPPLDPLFPRGLSDMVWVTLGYPSGIQVTLHLCWANPDKQRRLCLVGDDGALIFDELDTHAPLTLQQGQLDYQEGPDSHSFTPINQQRHIIDLEAVEPLQQVCTHFLECVQSNQPSTISSGHLGTKLIGILAAITQSLNQGGLPIHTA
ncbi:MAG: Gfo/Idh/MocA family oxidoreductase [Merismopedia sp. SIO2A8]|nr:Gfo/Idh/MocA family oxidoreductase [Merismopedia sp. SIO2A8]